MVQDTVASFFPRELHPGQSVNVYVSWLGAYYEGRDITWAFIVNEFEVVKKKFMSDYLVVYYFKGPLFFFSSQQFRNNFIFHHNLFDNYSIVFPGFWP